MARKILFDIGHPAHVHLFKNPRKILMHRDWEVFVLAREKEVTRSLLDDHAIDYIPGTKKLRGIFSALELMQWCMKARRVITEKSIDIVASIGSPAGAWAAKTCGIPHLAFNDTETALSQRLLYKPASAKIYTPDCLLADYGAKHIRYKGTHDLAYLRPEWFTPDPSIKAELGLGPSDAYAVLRFVSWEATHDWGQRPVDIDFKREMVSVLSGRYRVFISAEKQLPPDLEAYRLRVPPSRLHDVIAFASFVAGDGSTTLTEAACMGIPAMYISPFAESLGCILFYEKYHLLKSYKNSQNAIMALKEMPDDDLGDAVRKAAREKMLSETIDVSMYIADRIEDACAGSSSSRQAKVS